MIVLHYGKPTFISLSVFPPMYRSKSAKFQLCHTVRSIITLIFKRTALPSVSALFLFLFFSKSGGRHNDEYAFQYTFKNNITQCEKNNKKKRKHNVWTFTTIFAVGHLSSF